MSILYGPKQRRKDGQLTGRWDFCETDHFGKVSPVGNCMTARYSGQHDGHHSSAEAAVRCFYDYVMENLKIDGKNMMMFPCAICRRNTFGCSMIGEEPFFPCCGAGCGKMLKAKMKDLINGAIIEIYAEACDNEKLPESPDES